MFGLGFDGMCDIWYLFGFDFYCLFNVVACFDFGLVLLGLQWFVVCCVDIWICYGICVVLGVFGGLI